MGSITLSSPAMKVGSCLSLSLALLSAFLLAGCEANAGCRGSWLDASSVGMGCLLFNSTEKLSFFQASQYCKPQYIGNTSALVEVLTVEQMDFLTAALRIIEATIGEAGWWAGATDLGVEDDWFWLRSKQTVGEYVFSSFSGSSITSNCLQLLFNMGYKGYSQRCENLSFPICQWFQPEKSQYNFIQEQK